ncbi:MAG: hypothetical protein BWX64_01559 [Acidobacteria bacterium ADurb.Bin051]|nr:MAG: hypothetical protein BWX64_01559 [Acidobacteria bacterium ADurb.Bin051]
MPAPSSGVCGSMMNGFSRTRISSSPSCVKRKTVITGASSRPAVRTSGSPSIAPKKSQMRKLPFCPAQKAASWKKVERSLPEYW